MPKKIPSFTTPIGRAVWPSLNTPNTNFNPEGTFEVDLALEGAEAEAFKAQCDEWLEVSKIKNDCDGVGVPYKPEVDKETNEPTGATLFSFKMYATKKDGTPNTVRFFDAEGKPDMSNPKVGSGSRIRISGSVMFTSFGSKAFLKMAPYKVQIAELVEYNGGGFDAIEGGSYEAAPEQAQESFIDGMNNTVTAGTGVGSDY